MRALVCTLLAVCVAACGGATLMNTRVEAKAKGWTIAVKEVTDGPNSYSMGGAVGYKPASNERFLWVEFSFQNDRDVPQTFNYDRCGLDLGTKTLLPNIVDRDLFILSEIRDESEEVKPGEAVSRRLIFSYPEDKLPTTFACGEAVIPLALRR